MKQMLFCVCSLISGNILAQTNPLLVTVSYEADKTSFKQQDSTVYKYSNGRGGDLVHLPLKFDTAYVYGTAFQMKERIVQLFDAGDHILSSIRYNNNWQKIGGVYSTYDIAGNQLTDTDSATYKMDASYNQLNQRVTETMQAWLPSNNNYDHYHRTYTYNSSGLVSDYEEQRWVGFFDNRLAVHILYNSNGVMTDSVSQSWNFNTHLWVDAYAYRWRFNSGNQLQTFSKFAYWGLVNNWVMDDSTTYFYQNGDLSLSVRYRWVNNNYFKKGGKDSFVYNLSGQVDTAYRIDVNSNIDAWAGVVEKNVYSYDASGNVTERILKIPAPFTNYKRSYWTYNQDGQLTLYGTNSWDFSQQAWYMDTCGPAPWPYDPDTDCDIQVRHYYQYPSAPLTTGRSPASFVGWHIYPNPASDMLCIDLSDWQGTGDLMLMDLNGRILRRLSGVRAGKTLIATSDLAEGSYFLRLRADSGVQTEKILVVH